MRRLLVVSPAFPPLNAPDEHRARMMLPSLLSAGWSVTVLCADDPTPQAPVEWELLETVPAEVEVVRARCASRRWTSRLGVNSLGLRAMAGLYAKGAWLLRRQRFDLVLFSTTQFVVMTLGPIWKRRFGVPYVIDLQDPWVNDFYDSPGAPTPPGGWKHRIVQWSARFLESWTLAGAGHTVSVSPAYLGALERRYRWWDSRRASVVPFGASRLDFRLASLRPVSNGRWPATGRPRIVYAGRVVPHMAPALEVLFGALHRLEERGAAWDACFFGTNYVPGTNAPSTVVELATSLSVSHLVHETAERLGFLEAIRLMLEADAVLLLGSTDPAYVPSKLYPALVSGTPVIALAPASSALAGLAKDVGLDGLVEFALPHYDGAQSVEAASRQLSERLLSIAVQGSGRRQSAAASRGTDRWSAVDDLMRRQVAILDDVTTRPGGHVRPDPNRRNFVRASRRAGPSRRASPWIGSRADDGR